MKVTLYMAISIDGFVATKDGGSDWVSEVDGEHFMNEIAAKGCIVVGNTTFYQFLHDLYPVEKITNIVMSTSKKSDANMPDNVLFAANAEQALQLAEANGRNEVLLIGGGHTNGAFLEQNLIDEIILSVHPLILGKGIKLFEQFEKQIDLELIRTESMDDGLVKIVYRVIK